ncbi:MAG: thioredoxin family protein [Acidobacteriia bacterium]|nr:thioredoxin family protein [Terriglobia bacterium]
MESTRGPGKSQNLANVATIVVSVLLSVVLVKVFLLPQPSPAPNLAQPRVGMNLGQSLPGIDWAKNKRTLVLALSTQCHFCTESAPFFQRIQKETAKNLKMVAVLPQAVRDGHRYLEGVGVRVDDVRQAQLSEIGVTGTPTLLLVNGKGTVADVWQGKLQPDQEAAVLEVLKKVAP